MIKLNFSERTGKKSIIKPLGPDEISIKLSNRLWNCVEMFFLSKLGKGRNRYTNNNLSFFDEFARTLWNDLYGLSIEEIKYKDHYDITDRLRNKFNSSAWHEKYDFIEFILHGEFVYNLDKFVEKVNQTLRQEGAIYRLINSNITPIENELDRDEIEVALKKVNNYSKLQGVNVHLNQALRLLSNRENPDYRNSIKESISAIEATCRVLTNQNTLGKALNIMKSKGLIANKELILGFEKFYAYTNDKKSGIRHSIVENHIEPDRIDAKYFLVTSSAFINLLIEKISIKSVIDDDNLI